MQNVFAHLLWELHPFRAKNTDGLTILESQRVGGSKDERSRLGVKSLNDYFHLRTVLRFNDHNTTWRWRSKPAQKAKIEQHTLERDSWQSPRVVDKEQTPKFTARYHDIEKIPD